MLLMSIENVTIRPELPIMLIGYARVSTEDQNLELQLAALKRASCKRIFTDKVSGAKADRPGLRETLSHLRETDTLVVWKLDRLGRSVKGLVDLVNELQERHVHFKSLTDGIDTKTAGRPVLFSRDGKSCADGTRADYRTDTRRIGSGKTTRPCRWPKTPNDRRQGQSS